MMLGYYSKIFLVLIIVALTLPQIVFCQKVYPGVKKKISGIQGRVCDIENKKGIPYSSIGIIHDGNLICSGVTDSIGNFFIVYSGTEMRDSSIEIKATNVGYSAGTSKLFFKNSDQKIFFIELRKCSNNAMPVTNYAKPTLDYAKPILGNDSIK